jgi:hypothetical protein
MSYKLSLFLMEAARSLRAPKVGPELRMLHWPEQKRTGQKGLECKWRVLSMDCADSIYR